MGQTIIALLVVAFAPNLFAEIQPVTSQHFACQVQESGEDFVRASIGRAHPNIDIAGFTVTDSHRFHYPEDNSWSYTGTAYKEGEMCAGGCPHYGFYFLLSGNPKRCYISLSRKAFNEETGRYEYQIIWRSLYCQPIN